MMIMKTEFTLKVVGTSLSPESAQLGGALRRFTEAIDCALACTSLVWNSVRKQRIHSARYVNHKLTVLHIFVSGQFGVSWDLNFSFSVYFSIF